VADSLVSVIPTFRPDSETRTLLGTLASVAPVIVSDDASPCTHDVLLAQLAMIRGVELVRHAVNAGIGRGLNEGLEFARGKGATWLLTADQDSRITAEYLRALVDFATKLRHHGVPVGAVGAEVVRDASGPITYPTRAIKVGAIRYIETEELIQSGTLWHVPSLARLGGFNLDLGMDAVDAAACLGMRELGKVIVVAPGLEFHHHIGRARQIRVLGKSVMITRHNQRRRFSMVRNRLTLFPREFRQSPRHALRSVRRALLNASLSSLPTGRSDFPPPSH
jgi:rhamnosyltransferase